MSERARSPRISLIVAMDRNDVIGRGNALPWHLPADLRHFRRLTLGKPVIMGRRTHESLGRPLPERTNIVISRDPGFRAPGCLVARALPEALDAAGAVPEVMVIGGAEVFEAALPRAARIYLTRVHAEVAGDARFPRLDPAAWREIEREDHPADERNPYPYSFVTLERR
ncbi:MAG: type 3 dihydrofolate reductase [Gammaproteobacteria bacterium]|nr:type 3 dihydrofolate reductase [Gammaproteobacteria bacterium]